jgi:ABC-type nickel/cobalt efflux system permease component RcnA
MDTNSGFAVVLLLAALFGAAHALTPGHGKTLVAAYLVGERGTVWHAVFLGVVTTLSHTGVVLILAFVLWWLFGDRVPPGLDAILKLAGGMMVAGLGLWLLNRRLLGRADHFHFGAGHHHHDGEHGHSHGGLFHWHSHSPGDHVHAAPSAEFSAAPQPAGVATLPQPVDTAAPAPGWRPLVWLGIAGGMIPCFDATLLLVSIIAAGRLSRGVPVLLAFSAGLASVLVAIGIVVVSTKKYVDARWGKSNQLGKLVRALPLVSAVLVTLLGFWLCYDSVHGGK